MNGVLKIEAPKIVPLVKISSKQAAHRKAKTNGSQTSEIIFNLIQNKRSTI